ncbi:hypothetical protein WICPIJ_006809 [Wickerhamomyces pijperi]|uniref:Pre-mRNA-splicing factor CWC24 n=1 Tax=Wickerhamomyces pijperi TaxID=599730 RepID=A0A9P8TJV8_WICPI|nr:hypothetical protein WICPIJ_006809 [Wickerhamomyces pijperi]
MFKKRTLKGSIRTKAIKRTDESDGSDSEQDTVILTKRQKTIDNTDTGSLKNKNTCYTKPSQTLSHNDEATKADILNQEIIDKDRLRKNNTHEEHQDDGLYKGQANYKQLIPSKSNMDTKGPKKAASNIRSTTVFDFQRDICKDFRDTGFCGYGDSCKFMHSRDDFKAGWKLNTDWKLGDKSESEKLDDVKEIPFKCVICKDAYKKPVVTKCGHYFCEECYLKRFKKGLSKCFICQEPTNGVVKPAKNLNELIKQ